VTNKLTAPDWMTAEWRAARLKEDADYVTGTRCNCLRCILICEVDTLTSSLAERDREVARLRGALQLFADDTSWSGDRWSVGVSARLVARQALTPERKADS